MQEYIDIGLERIQKLSEDSLKTRPIYQKIYEPSGRDFVSKYPVEWLEKRLHEIEKIVQEDNIRNEIKKAIDNIPNVVYNKSKEALFNRR